MGMKKQKCCWNWDSYCIVCSQHWCDTWDWDKENWCCVDCMNLLEKTEMEKNKNENMNQNKFK